LHVADGREAPFASRAKRRYKIHSMSLFPSSDSAPTPPPILFRIPALLAEAHAHLTPESPLRARIERAQSALQNASPTVLLSGLRSVGKSSLVCSLWGDSELLPTAERDCTQTNTLIRLPGVSEGDRTIRLAYLPRAAATQFAIRGLAFHRLAELLTDELGPMGPRLDEGTPEVRLRTALSAVQRLFLQRPKLAVLNENLSDDLKEIAQLLDFLDTPDFREGEVIDAQWADRREHLMGRRHPDGRTLDVGRLLALQHVELVRTSHSWSGAAPRLIDTPYVPTLYNARRADLILSQARRADILVIVARPEPLFPEDWVKTHLKERPEIAARTLVVFNQIDTVDLTQLFARDGFAAAFEKNLQRLHELRIKPQNVFVTCARLPFLVKSLEAGAPDASLEERIKKLRAVMERLRKQADGRQQGLLKDLLLQSCDERNSGIESVRKRIQSLGQTLVYKSDLAPVLQAIQQSDELNNDAAGRAIQHRASSLHSDSIVNF